MIHLTRYCVLFQFYILVTNLLILGLPVGKKNGSRQLKSSYEISSNVITLGLKPKTQMGATQRIQDDRCVI